MGAWRFVREQFLDGDVEGAAPAGRSATSAGASSRARRPARTTSSRPSRSRSSPRRCGWARGKRRRSSEAS